MCVRTRSPLVLHSPGKFIWATIVCSRLGDVGVAFYVSTNPDSKIHPQCLVLNTSMEWLKPNKVGPHCIEEDNRTYMSSLSRVPLVVGIGVDTRDVIIPQRRVQWHYMQVHKGI